MGCQHWGAALCQPVESQNGVEMPCPPLFDTNALAAPEMCPSATLPSPSNDAHGRLGPVNRSTVSPTDYREPQPDISTVAAHFADRSRARMLLELVDGCARPASHLASVAGVSASTGSSHLARLLEAGLIEVTAEGRHRRYQITDDRVVVVLESLLPLAITPQPNGLRAHSRWQRMRVARSCYDHLAGGLGTDVMAGLVERGALERIDGISGTAPGAQDPLSAPVPQSPYRLGPEAPRMFGQLDIDVDELGRAPRPMLRACTDWTEQRHHLAGGLGAAVLDAFLGTGWVQRRANRRDLRVERPERISKWLEC